MNDERYSFVEDVRDKKRIASGAHHKRTHCGKGGAVKLPSDFLSKKELKAMNGEVKSYRLNSPMTWSEFKAAPDDIKITYIKALRNRFGVPDNKIAEMMGVHKVTVCKEVNRLGIAHGTDRSRRKWDKDGFEAWMCRDKADAMDCCEAAPTIEPTPLSDDMTLEKTLDDALELVRHILAGTTVRVNITFDILARGEQK